MARIWWPSITKSYLPGFLIFWIAITVLFLETSGNRIRIADEILQKTGTWDFIDLTPYSESRASFTRDPKAEISYHFASAQPVRLITLGLGNYAAGTNRIEILLDDQPPLTVVQPPAKVVGPESIQVPLPSETTVSLLRIRPIEIGQYSFIVDHIDLKGAGFPFKRVALVLALVSAVVSVFAIAGRFVRAMTPSSGQALLFIDVTRGIAVLLVVLHHMAGYSQLPAFAHVPLFKRLVANGHLGVEIFYFISAYTLTLSLLAGSSKANPVTEFWLRRLTRIMPVFVTVVVLVLAARPLLYPTLAADLPPGTWWRYASLTYIFDQAILNGVVQHSVWWSISTEFQFYALMPVFFFGAVLSVRRLRDAPGYLRFIGAATIAALGIAVSRLTLDQLAEVGWSQYLVFKHFDVFMAGMALAVLPMRNLSSLAIRPYPWAVKLCAGYGWMAIMVLAVAYYGIYPVTEAVSVSGIQRLVFIALLGLSIATARWLEQIGFGGEAGRLLRTAGILSFIIYLLHVPAMQLSQRYLSSGLFASSEQVYGYFLLTSLLICVPLAVLLHRFIEVPGLALSRRFKDSAVVLGGVQLYLIVIAFLFFMSAADRANP
ncbi:acyltransferase [Microvirga sp. 17 mud 1-3]|uniref:acyltransferase family protein n=1 Tax=Microvirga sp. 17 mud 1-3 TaxID=2082949 RepID=UPI0013A542D9|nr:acyltransferase [Microvirga sp. 17 mud 1-3]